MLRSGLSSRTIGETSHPINQFIQTILDTSLPDAAFRNELHQVLSRWAEVSPVTSSLSMLPTLAAQASGGDPNGATPVTAAWQCVRLAAKLLDDVEDGDADGQSARMINVATGLLFSAQLVLEELASRLSPSVVLQIGQEMQRAMLRAGAGQHADLLAGGDIEQTPEPDAWLAIALAKSGQLLGWATWAGACAAGAHAADQACFREYGSNLGVLLQVADDYNGVWRSIGASDLTGRHLSLAVCYGRFIAQGSTREELDRLLERAARKERAAEAQARQLLTDLGAPTYLVAVARIHHDLALDALLRSAGPPTALEPLRILVDQVFPMPGDRVPK